MSPINPPHDHALDRFNEWSFQVLPRGQIWVRVQGSIGLEAFDSQPQPDLVWLARKDYFAKRPTPKDVRLLVEISDTTTKKDRGEKSRLYAEAGIRDYWIVNIRDGTIEVRRDRLGTKYRDIVVYREGEVVRPLAFPDAGLEVSRLFPE